MNKQQGEIEAKIQRIILELNRTGLAYLTNNQFQQSLTFLKKAEKVVASQLQLDPKNIKVNKLAAVTYNNLGCYYKKSSKPKVALSYLKKALELEVHRISDLESTAGTHLNVCAIYSYMGNHEEAADHAQLAIEILQNQSKKKLTTNDKNDEEKSYANILMISHYNFAIQLEYLKLYEQSMESYKVAKKLAKKGGKKNTQIIIAAEEGIKRVEEQFNNQKKKLNDIIETKKDKYQKGHYQFMAKNKRYYNNSSHQRITNHNKNSYRYESGVKMSKYNSTERFKLKLQPISKTEHRQRITTQQ